KATIKLARGIRLGKISKGERCSVIGCGNTAVRSLSADRVKSAGLKIEADKRAYLCEGHYKEYKKKTKLDRMIEKWRYMSP
ncbi:MAG: hypothetical protein QXY75_01415, partial [Candidatus Bathyarchaeia archaeon]